jgi:flagellar motor switch protein FliG
MENKHSKGKKIDGVQTVVDMLKVMDEKDRKRILDDMAKKDPVMTQKILGKLAALGLKK